MTKAELIERIARSRDVPPDMTKKAISEIVDVAFAELAAYFTRAKVTRSNSPRFTFPGFGTFTKKKRSARRGVNPRTLEPMEIEASYTLDFRPGSELRAAMNPQRKGAAESTSNRKPRTTSKSGAKKRSGSGSGRRKSAKKRAAKRVAKRKPASVRGRVLTPRDEDAELDALIDDDALFDDVADALPSSPMQRARSEESTTRRRRTG